MLEGAPLPSLLRFLLIVAVIGLAGFGLAYVLANFVRPATRPMSVDVPLTRLNNDHNP
jgi:hypothetical protein